jgi:hypothetical protein
VGSDRYPWLYTLSLAMNLDEIIKKAHALGGSMLWFRRVRDLDRAAAG